ncbi:ferredoxin [Pseudomonas mohnii]
MKVVIDQPGCVGHARCHNVAPTLYPLDDNGYIASSGFNVPEGQEGLAQRGARACPERVIEVRDAPAETRQVPPEAD